MGQGAAFRLLLQRITATISDAAAEDALREFREALQAAVEMATDVSTRLADIAQRGQTERFLAHAAAYLDMLGPVVIAWMWLQPARAAQRALATASAARKSGVQGKSVSVSLDLGVCRLIKKKNTNHTSSLI